ncbi:hypothetical protein A0130_09555 [Leifsonia xyli]|nr:hypothetical protein A0130_09555 [Leifsonia xyli]
MITDLRVLRKEQIQLDWPNELHAHYSPAAHVENGFAFLSRDLARGHQRPHGGMMLGHSLVE